MSELQASARTKPAMVMIAGPNGAGKTTLWREMLEPMLEGEWEAEYVNATEIERELNVVAPHNQATHQASEVARTGQTEATRRRALMLSAPPEAQWHFVYETVFSDTTGYKLAELTRGVKAGYFVVMLFVGLDDITLAEERIRARVLAGGHDVPTDVQQARFPRVFENAKRGMQIVPLAMFFDNTEELEAGRGTHRPIAVVKNKVVIAQRDDMPEWWQLIVR
ncbi:putative ABC-type ATPase [Paraburkholderia sp. RAU6.4a]|uniref:zeta toxin family protein n=1 Tax=Paraburkholderia sp. RAU6.4a TaxID=2991067 RepID=UPI003D2253D0